MPHLGTCLWTLLALRAALAAPARSHWLSLLQVKVAQFREAQIPDLYVAERTLKTLDTDGDGHVGPNEISNFASLVHISGAEAASDLKELDADGDGKLNSNELMHALAGTTLQENPRAVPAAEEPGLQAVPSALRADEAPLKASASSLASTAMQLGSVRPVSAVEAAASGIAVPLAVSSTQTTVPAATSLVAAYGTAANAVKAAEYAWTSGAFPQAVASPAPGEHDLATLHGAQSETDLTASAAASDAAAHTVRKGTGQILEQFMSLEHQAEQAEVEAAMLRAKARLELQSSPLTAAPRAPPFTEGYNSFPLALAQRAGEQSPK